MNPNRNSKDNIPGNNQGDYDAGSMNASEEAKIELPFRGSVARDDHLSSSQYSNNAHIIGDKINFNRGSGLDATSPKEGETKFRKNNFDIEA